MTEFCLGGDIGGTKTWLALTRCGDAPRQTVFEQRYPSPAFGSFESILEDFLHTCPQQARTLRAACLGVAGPVLDQQVRVTNLPWQLRAADLAERLRAPVQLVNDFEATARGIEQLGCDEMVTLQEGDAAPYAPRLVIGAGTGLGIAFMVRVGERYCVVPTEAGRNAFAPTSPEQVELWRYLYSHHARATFELILSGKGLVRLYDFLRLQHRASDDGAAVIAASADPAALIVSRGLSGADAICSEAIDWFLQIFGARAGDLALTVLARGGVYVAGGIAPKLLPRIREGGFLRALCDKGIHSKLVRAMPIHVITSERVGLLGSLALAEQLV